MLLEPNSLALSNTKDDNVPGVEEPKAPGAGAGAPNNPPVGAVVERRMGNVSNGRTTWNDQGRYGNINVKQYNITKDDTYLVQVPQILQTQEPVLV